MHVSPWKQSHTLMREYTTVLYMHKSDFSSVLGPGYKDPVGRGATVNASKNKVIRYHHGNAPTCGVNGEHSQPPLHGDWRYAATIHSV